MKAIILSAALLMSAGIFAGEKMSNNLPESNVVPEVQAIAQSADGFVPVKVEDLNEKVVGALKVYAETNDITALSYNAEKKLTKVDLSAKADGSTKTIILDDEGKETTADAAAPAESTQPTEPTEPDQPTEPEGTIPPTEVL